MRRAIILSVAAMASAAGAAAAFAATVAVPVQVTLARPASIAIGDSLSMPTVTITPAVPNSGLNATQRVQSTRNAQLTIRGQPGDVVSTTVPESFQVVRNGGQETLTVRTNTQAEFQIGGDVVLGGSILNGATMSVDVGGGLTLASAQHLAPGPYEGMLVVLVQYN